MHKLENGEVKIFSRNSEDMTSKYPDLIQALPAAIKSDVTSFVMDAEVRGHKEDRERCGWACVNAAQRNMLRRGSQPVDQIVF